MGFQPTWRPGVYAIASLIERTHVPHLRTTLQTLAASHLHLRAGSSISFAAI